MSRHDNTNIFALFFNVMDTTQIYSLSLHDALPIFEQKIALLLPKPIASDSIKSETSSFRFELLRIADRRTAGQAVVIRRSEEHTSELQSRGHLVCRLLLEKKK